MNTQKPQARIGTDKTSGNGKLEGFYFTVGYPGSSAKQYFSSFSLREEGLFTFPEMGMCWCFNWGKFFDNLQILVQ
jgi:hypothetical protein